MNAQALQQQLELARMRALLILSIARDEQRSAEERLSSIEGEAEHFLFVATKEPK